MKAKKILKVIENLERMLPYAQNNGSLDMSCGTVSTEKGKNLCGTTQCHGGWYAIAALSYKKRKEGVEYDDGANKMAKHLGFKESVSKRQTDVYEKGQMIEASDKLCSWANKNPEIWGNTDGNIMFSCYGRMAFYHETKRPDGALTLQHIVDHWKEVYERLWKMENPNKEFNPEVEQEESRKDITAKLAILPVDETLDTVKVEKQVLVYE